MYWGYAGPWYGQFLEKDGVYPEDKTVQFYRRYAFLQRFGLQCTGLSLASLDAMADAEREAFFQFISDNDLYHSAHAGFKYLEADDATIARYADDYAALLAKYQQPARVILCTTGPHAGHRFDRVLPLEEKLQRLAKAMSPLARVIHDAGLNFGIENHCDYYISDLVELCQRVPHLGIFLDTGNTYMIGEKPLTAFQEAAPYTVGTHFKDHYVCPRPNGRPMNFEVTGAPLGEGDVPLRECFDLLKAHAPNLDTLVMEIEMIAPKEMNPWESMERSMAFVHSLKQEVSA